MALIPVYFSVANYFRIDNASTTPIPPGTVMSLSVLDASLDSFVEICNGVTSPIGVAADAFLSEFMNPPASGYAADIVTGAFGNSTTRSTNRINDLFMETRGSGLMTVYTGVGTFRTTVYDPTVTASQWVSALNGKLYSNANGQLTPVGTQNSIGTLVGVPKAFPSGVPGTQTWDGSMSLGTYLTFNLRA